jgi:hypothetical protein
VARRNNGIISDPYLWCQHGARLDRSMPSPDSDSILRASRTPADRAIEHLLCCSMNAAPWLKMCLKQEALGFP